MAEKNSAFNVFQEIKVYKPFVGIMINREDLCEVIFPIKTYMQSVLMFNNLQGDIDMKFLDGWYGF